ncbi:ATP-binding protein [Mycobacterium antarcticum]|uniref:ATP-binding protein n=1 Tax=unclassified Mycolicibacterium TaxID=2636767 RepID=UPI0024E13AB2|nr:MULTISPECIES: ATP-binding protein [unclassified Mycolicibacterium]
MDELHDQLSRMWSKGVFEPAIHYIRFPVFKNLVTGLRIEFSHPLTAIVGPNGCNKTAILRALQGSPTGNDLGNYWFGTAMDAIAPDARHRFIYGRYSDTARGLVEVVKTRIGRRRSSRSKNEIDPDLFEPSRPLTSAPDNMDKYHFSGAQPKDGSKTRWNTLDKEVLYLDFRSQLSAFDWAFYHSEINRPGALTFMQALRLRKSAIRKRSTRLAGAISEQKRSDVWYGAERIIKPIHSVGEEELVAIQAILGRKYESIRVIHHRYFGRQGGWTVLMKAAGIQYSEAFAGSGEYAAVMLVCSVLAAEPKSLILFDEPEVSLHPSAQREVINFLSNVAKRHHHQIVLATHAPEMVRTLPVNAIKVLSIRADDGRVDMPSQGVAPHAAFEAVGASYDRPTVVVEDRLAAALVRFAIKGLPIADSVDVKFIPGGAETLWSHYVPMWAHDERGGLLLLLDGDQKTDEPVASGNVAPDHLEEVVVASLNGNEPKLPYGSSEEESAGHRRESLRAVLDWRRMFVNFLPVDTPEEFLLRSRDSRLEQKTLHDEERKVKGAWLEIATQELGRPASGDEIFVFQQAEISKLSASDETVSLIAGIVQGFVESVKL